MERILFKVRRIIPARLFAFLQPIYHLSLGLVAACLYRFPSRSLKVIAVTGTKGKTSVTEILNAILEEAGYKTAVSNTIRFKIGASSRPNLYKMSMPGRFFLQRFLREAVSEGCGYAVMEATSQGALLHRHRLIDFDALIFTNIAPEHIEAHGSFEKYIEAKLSIAESAAKSKKGCTLVANSRDPVSERFLAKDFAKKITYSLEEAKPCNVFREGFALTYKGVLIKSSLPGEFNAENALAAIKYAESEGISVDISKRAIERLTFIPGRVEKIDMGQDFSVVVDYAHTPDSLEKFYKVFKGTRRICVLGNTGGGRDVWKRDEMAKIAERDCDEIILTNEDPYDDDPMQIVRDMAQAMTSKKPRVVIDRREAIRKALSLAAPGDSVLITGKGTDPYIMGPNGSKTPWSDAEVVRQELADLTRS